MLKESYKFFEDGINETINRLLIDIAGLRTGRILPEMVNNILVEIYGSKTPINGLASVNNTDVRSLAVSPWDPGSAGAIVDALTKSNLGVMPTIDSEVIRLSWPSLTQEIRNQTIKTLHQKAEVARVRLRQSRDEALRILKDHKASDHLTEDELFEGREKLDEMIGDANEKIEDIIKSKELDIKSI